MSNPKMLFLFSLFFISFAYSASYPFNNTPTCSATQAHALLLFKQDTFSIDHIINKRCGYDYNSVLMNWKTSIDCCNWEGVTCNHFTGDVIALDLSCAKLKGTIHPNTTLFHLPHLKTLSLAYNKLNGTLPSLLFSLPSLETLELTGNNFSGSLPSQLFNHQSLKELYLGQNQFVGKIDMLDQDSTVQAFWKVITLTTLDLSFNNFIGVWELDTLLSRLTNITYLYLSYSGLSVVTNNDAHYVNPNFQILGLAACKLNVFPKSLRAMKNLQYLDLSNNGIIGHIPDWAGEIGRNELYSLNLSHNSITSLPQFQWATLGVLDLQTNLIQGPFPPSIRNLENLYYLDMSNNNFSGEIPQWFSFNSLQMVDLGNNSFHGTIPIWDGSYGALRGLILKENHLEGEVPRWLSEHKYLTVLDLGNNHLNGTFPHWLGNLSYLQVLLLKSNKLHGPINSSSMIKNSFPSLKVLDLSQNEFEGQLCGKYFQNFDAMKNVEIKGTIPQYLSLGIFSVPNKFYSITVAVKGSEREFKKFLVDYTIVDLSGNKLEGEIPNEICTLNSLIVLNLSNNNLNGQIPHAIGNLSQIQSLDLSWNQLTGKIPQSLADITYLEVLNLSQNHLVGRIPAGTQLSTFNASFSGNPGLCGPPLPVNCERPSSPQAEEADGDDDEASGFTWKVVMLGYGCGTLLGLVMGYLMLSTGRPKWFNAIADEIEHMIQTKQKKRRKIIYIGK